MGRLLRLIVETQNLTKYYGPSRGVENLDLEVMEGEIFGFLGPNGAGKTTTIRLLLDLIRPSRGFARILGWDVQKEGTRLKRFVGNLPGELKLYENLTGAQFLSFVASMRGGVDLNYQRDLVERFELDLSMRISSYSHGMKQKLGLVQAIFHRPKLVLLDEPTQGLDPLMQQEFYRILLELKQSGCAVFLSSHVLPEVERTCDRIGIIRDGHLVAVESVEEITRKAARHMEITFARPVPAKEFELARVSDVIAEGNTLRFSVRGNVDDLIKHCARFPIVDLYCEKPSLEDVFLAYYRQEDVQKSV
ncbi:MAG: ABC transporter ATP-binding protein [Chloroflexi bacterium]|nr:ABC transporter ATP-binding protein [Chloroflexota bacterium]